MMLSKEQFHLIYSNVPLGPYDVEDYIYGIFNDVFNGLIEKLHNNPVIFANIQTILEYIMQEYLYFSQGKSEQEIHQLFDEKIFRMQFVKIVSDKFIFNEVTPYEPISLISYHSPVISTMELNLNFILNRIEVIKKNNPHNDILIDMFTKVFSMFKSLNYLLSNGFETEAFATWRTIHELECVIAIIDKNKYIVPVYLQHIIYNNAFRNTFENKEEQQAVIDDLKSKMKAHDLKSKDMKKYIEYGWMYSIKNVEEVEGFKLNFRNGLEALAGLERYAKDYEMSSEVAHSSPLLIFSNKSFFKAMTIVRSYESFLRLEEIFYHNLLTYSNVDSTSYESMRNLYLEFAKRILSRESLELNKILSKAINSKKPYK